MNPQQQEARQAIKDNYIRGSYYLLSDGGGVPLLTKAGFTPPAVYAYKDAKLAKKVAESTRKQLVYLPESQVIELYDQCIIRFEWKGL